MRIIKRVMFLTLLLSIKVSANCIISQDSYDTSIKNVSLLNLIVMPERYQEKEIAVIGKLKVDHGVAYLFFDDRAYNNLIFAEAIGLQIQKNSVQFKDVLNLSSKYVEVIGNFNFSKFPHVERELSNITLLCNTVKAKN